jgi:ribose transport system substrate-binding protein
MMQRIAVFVKNDQNPNYRAFLHGADRIGTAAGARITHHVPAQPDNAVEQAALLRSVIAERPDAILFAPADDHALEEPVAEAAARRIPLIGFVNRMRGDFVSFIGADDVAMGRRITEVIIESLGGQGSVVLIEGPETAPTSRDRGTGFRQAIAASPGIRLLGAAPGRYLRAGGRDAMAGLLAAHSRIDAVICSNDMMALGALDALDALDAAGRTALVVGNNGTIEAAEEIGRGRLLASMDYCGFRMGALATMAALRHIAGQPVPREVMLPAEVVHRGNYAAWLMPIEARPLPVWDELVGV